MRHKWSSAYIFQWTPILTFSRRRLELLEWFEAHTEPVAFFDAPESIGISLVNSDLRLVIARSHMHVEIANPISTADSLLPGIEGAFEVLQPKDVTQSRASMLQSRALPGLDYNEGRAAFAGRMLGSKARSLRPVDASTLADIEGHDWRGQLEWGVVSPEELKSRLLSPALGRLDQSRPPVRDVVVIDTEDLSPASLLVDVVLLRQLGGSADSAHQVVTRITEVDEVVATFVDEMQEEFIQQGGSDELAQA